MSTDSNTTMPALLQVFSDEGFEYVLAADAEAAISASEARVQALQREVEELRAANERMAEWINGDCFCPCCGNTIACTDGCDFATDCPDAAQRMAEARAVLSYRAIRSEGNQ